MRFLHLADVHLGNQQYNLGARFNDFGRAFFNATQLAVEKTVAAVVIAGDLFHKSTVDAPTMIQAEAGLRLLHDHSIPVLAVHGNHDKARYREQYSWVDYLDEMGLLHLLAPDYTADPVQLTPGDGYIDVGGVRFVGVPWLGVSAARILQETAEALAKLDKTGIRFTVLVTHAGVEGQMPHTPGVLTHTELAPLRDQVDYLALGHLHKPYADMGWYYNPGSLETCSFDEAQWADQRGVYLVEVDDSGRHKAELIPTVKRPFYTIECKVDFSHTPEALFEDVQTRIREERRPLARQVKLATEQFTARGLSPDQAAKHARPVVRLILRGNLAFARSELDLERIRQLVTTELASGKIETLTVRAENRALPPGFAVMSDETLGRAELERSVFRELAKKDSRFSAQAEQWGALMQRVKDAALRQVPPEEIFALLDVHMDAGEETTDVDHQTATE